VLPDPNPQLTDVLLDCQVFKLVEAKRNVTLRFYVTKMLPVGLFMALTLHFGNLVYLYLTVSDGASPACGMLFCQWR
jgi:hypothetical protein